MYYLYTTESENLTVFQGLVDGLLSVSVYLFIVYLIQVIVYGA